MLSKKLKGMFDEIDKRDPSAAASRELQGLFINIASTLARLREKSGLSQRKLAKLLNTSHPTIVRWETPGYTGYTIAKLAEFAEAVGYELIVRFRPKAETRLQTEVTFSKPSSWNRFIQNTSVQAETTFWDGDIHPQLMVQENLRIKGRVRGTISVKEVRQ